MDKGVSYTTLNDPLGLKTIKAGKNIPQIQGNREMSAAALSGYTGRMDGKTFIQQLFRTEAEYSANRADHFRFYSGRS